MEKYEKLLELTYISDSDFDNKGDIFEIANYIDHYIETFGDKKLLEYLEILTNYVKYKGRYQ